MAVDEVTQAICAAVRHLSPRDRCNLMQLRKIGSQRRPHHDVELLEWFLPVVDVPGVPTRSAAYHFMGSWVHEAMGGRARHWDDLALALAELSDLTGDEAALVLGENSNTSLSHRCDAASARRSWRVIEPRPGGWPERPPRQT